ncbi:MAG: 3-hydroxyacyl-CoA dehydrogenase family protein [Dehalococcoidia bacterium]
MRFQDVHTIGIAGGGVMGGGIAQVLALAGYEVIVRDLNERIIGETRDAIFEGRWGLKRAVEVGKLHFDRAVDAMARVTFTTDLDAIRDVQFLVEAIPELLSMKQALFAELDGLVNPEAIFVSNTSGFPIADVSRDVSPARLPLFAGMHFASPAPAMKMCEVITTPHNSPDTTETIREIAEKAGKTVCMVKDAPGSYGFVLNRVFAAARREAEEIVEAGIATPEDVDRAMMTGRNWPAGFFGDRGGIGQQW